MSVETYEPREPRDLVPHTVTDLATWATSARAAYSIAESLVKTSFVPEAFRGKAHEATAAILAGTEVGLSPMAALRSFDIIQGQAAPRAITLRAIVQSRGHGVWIEESTETRAIVAGCRKGSSREQRSTWTLDRAQKLGLAGKDNWRKQPGAMLVARATSELCRLIAADAILGLPYSVEELDDGDEMTEATPIAGKRTARRRTAVGVSAVGPAESAAAPRAERPEPALPGEDEPTEPDPEPSESEWPPVAEIPAS